MSTQTSTTSISNNDLVSGMVIVGDNDETLTVYDTYNSSTIPGMVVVETGFGCLYLDDEGTSVIVTPSE